MASNFDPSKYAASVEAPREQPKSVQGSPAPRRAKKKFDPTKYSSGVRPIETPAGGETVSPTTPARAKGAPAPASVDDREGGLVDGDNLVSPAELKAIAAKFDLPPDQVRTYAKNLGLFPEDSSLGEAIQTGIGGVQEHVLGGLPRQLYTKLIIDDPNARKAIDALSDLRDTRRSWLSAVTQMGSSVAGGGAQAKATAKLTGRMIKSKVAEKAAGLATAATAGALSAREGSEGSGAAIGAGIATLLPGGAKLAVGAKNKLSRVAAKNAVDDIVQSGVMDRVTERLSKDAEAEEALRGIIVSMPKKPTGIAIADAISAKADEMGIAPVELANRMRAQLGADADKPLGEAISAHVAQFQKAISAGGRRKGGLVGQVAREGEEHVAKQYSNWRKAATLIDEISKDPKLQHTEVGPIRGLLMKLADARHVYDAVDNRFGTELAPLLDNMSAKYNGYTVALHEAITNQQKAANQLHAAGGEEANERVFRALDTGNFEGLSDAERAAAEAYKNHFEYMAQSIEGLHTKFDDLDLSPLKIQRRLSGPANSWVPHQLVQRDEMMRRLEARVAAGKGLNDADTKRAVELVLGREVMNEGDLANAFAVLSGSRKMPSALATTGKSLFARNEAIPDFLLETDLNRLGENYAANMLRHAFLRDDLDALSRTGKALNKIDPRIGKYIENHVADIAGVRQGTIASSLARTEERLVDWATKKASESDDPVAKQYYGLVGQTPDIMRAMTKNMYSFFLGAKPDAVVRNMAQVFSATMPALSAKHPGYALKTTLGAYGKVFNEARKKGGWASIESKLGKEGLIPNDQLFDAQEALKEGISKSPLGAKGKAAVAAATKWSMAGYRAADAISRATSREMAQKIVGDLFTGKGADKKAAIAAIDNLTPGYKTAVARALRAGDRNEAARLYSNFLNGSTLYNYNKVSMAEFGRSVGSALSMFSKFPASVFGELGGMMDARAIGKPIRGDVGKVMWRYLGPLVLSSMAYKYVKEEFGEQGEDIHPAVRIGLGKDPRKYFLSDTVSQVGEALVNADITKMTAKPPVVEALTNSAKGAAALGSDEPENAIPNMAAPLLGFAVSGMPMATWARFFLSDVPKAMGEEAVVPMTQKDIKDRLAE